MSNGILLCASVKSSSSPVFLALVSPKAGCPAPNVEIILSPSFVAEVKAISASMPRAPRDDARFVTVLVLVLVLLLLVAEHGHVGGDFFTTSMHGIVIPRCPAAGFAQVTILFELCERDCDADEVLL